MQIWACLVGHIALNGEALAAYANKRLSCLNIDESCTSCRSSGNIHLLLCETSDRSDNAFARQSRNGIVASFSSWHAARAIPNTSEREIDLAEAFDLLRRNPRSALHLPAPSTAWGLAQDGVFHAFNDLAGFGKLYHAMSSDGYEVVSNSCAVAAVLVQSKPRPSNAGWSSYVQYGIFLGSTTPFSGVRKLGPATHIMAEPGDSKLSIQKYYSAAELFALKNCSNLSEELGAAIDDFMENVKTDLVDGVTIHFSGGRDSRCVAAAAIKAGLALRLETLVPPVVDGVLAKRLAAQVEGVEWELTELTDVYGTEEFCALNYEDLIARRVRWLEYWCGDFNSSIIYDPGDCSIAGAEGDGFTMKGLFSENARALLYGADKLPKEVNFDRSYFDYLRSPNAILSKSSNSSNEALVREFEGTADDQGIEGLTRLDMYDLLCRTRCRPDVALGSKALRPFGSPRFMRVGLAQSPEKRVFTEDFRDIVRLRVPAWNDVPYAHEVDASIERSVPNEQELFIATPPFADVLQRLRAGEIASHFLDMDALRARIDSFPRMQSKHRSKLVKQSIRIMAAESFARFAERLSDAATGEHDLGLAARGTEISTLPH